MSAFRASGGSGDVRYGYQTVARLERWTMQGDRIDATAADVNAFWIDRDGPFAVRLAMGSKYWVWRDAQIVSADPFVMRVNGSPAVED